MTGGIAIISPGCPGVEVVDVEGRGPPPQQERRRAPGEEHRAGTSRRAAETAEELPDSLGNDFGAPAPTIQSTRGAEPPACSAACPRPGSADEAQGSRAPHPARRRGHDRWHREPTSGAAPDAGATHVIVPAPRDARRASRRRRTGDGSSRRRRRRPGPAVPGNDRDKGRRRSSDGARSLDGRAGAQHRRGVATRRRGRGSGARTGPGARSRAPGLEEASGGPRRRNPRR